jgi:hypothetical protein
MLNFTGWNFSNQVLLQFSRFSKSSCKISLFSLLLKVLKALDDIKIFRNITDGENKEILQDDLENLENWSNTWLLKFHPVKLSI